MKEPGDIHSTMSLRLPLLLAVCLAILCLRSAAQEDAPKPQSPSDSPAQSQTADTDPLTIFSHSDSTRWYLGGQLNTIFQMHPGFSAQYSGPNSLRDTAEAADSRVLTLYTGYQLTGTTEMLLDLESAGGRGISNALGLAGFTNLDVVRNPSLGSTPYLARVMVRQIIPLSQDKVEAERDPLHLATQVPARRLEFRVGKFSAVDFFDLNGVGSDSHLQFMNWTVDNNGAYDYAADTRGYTWGALVEYYDPKFTVRFLEATMPKIANGLRFETDWRKGRAENLEFEFHPKVAGRDTIVRLLSYANHANMGDYAESIAEFREGLTPVPDITATRRQGRVKFGFGINTEQNLTRDIRWFVRGGWNNGQTESFVYTEVDDTAEIGGDVSGRKWKRKHDQVGAAFVCNGISHVHQQYLALGGLGFLLGDGALTYGRETIFEIYYNAHFWRGVFGAIDLQHINNPGYNQARGPVWVPALRMHMDF
jgi:hypothetical protein